MMRKYLKYRIRRAIDRGTNLPGWLVRRLSRDNDLRLYAQNYAEMLQSLSASSSSWMAESIDRLDSEPGRETAAWLQSIRDRLNRLSSQSEARLVSATGQRRTATEPAAVKWAMAIALLMFLIGGWLVSQQYSERARQRQVMAQKARLTLVATRAVWTEGHRVARRSLNLCEHTFQKVSKELVNRIAESTMAPLEDGGRRLGVAIHELHRGAEREKNSLTEMIKRLGAKLEDQQPAK